MIWTPTVNYPSWATEETSTPNKTCSRCCKNDERPTGTSTNDWVGGRWNLKIQLYQFWFYITVNIIIFLIIKMHTEKFVPNPGKTIIDSWIISSAVQSSMRSKLEILSWTFSYLNYYYLSKFNCHQRNFKTTMLNGNLKPPETRVLLLNSYVIILMYLYLF